MELTQQAFATKYGISQSLLSKYERGAVPPPADLLMQCIEVLRMAPEEVTPDDLVALVRSRLGGADMNAVRVALANVITRMATK